MGSLRSPMACNRHPDAMDDPARIDQGLVPVRVVPSPALNSHLAEELTEAVELLLSNEAHPRIATLMPTAAQR